MSINKSKLTKSIQDRGNYSTVPNDIWNQPISSKAKIVFIYLLSNSEKWSPGEREIAQATSIGRDTVRKALKELQINNMLIMSLPDQKGLRTKYEFISLGDWNTTKEKEVEIDAQVENSEPVLTEIDDISNTQDKGSRHKTHTDKLLNVSFDILTHPTLGDVYMKLTMEEQLQICSVPQKNQLSMFQAYIIDHEDHPSDVLSQNPCPNIGQSKDAVEDVSVDLESL